MDEEHPGSESSGRGLSLVARKEPGGALAEEEDDSNAGSEPSGSCLSPDAGQEPGVQPSELRDNDVPDLVTTFTELLGGMREFIDGPDPIRSFPRGIKGAYTLVRASLTRRRYEKIVAICGRDSVVQEEEPARTDYRWMITIKIPETKFDEVLRLDTYCRGDIGLFKRGNFSRGHRSHVNEVKLISLKQTDQSFVFYGTEHVFENLKAWKRRCEEISSRIQFQQNKRIRQIATTRWLAEAAARSDEYQVSEDGNTMDHTDPGPDDSDEVEYHNGRYSDDFTEQGIIGEGGFGIVVKARNKMDKYVYAVKKVFKKARDDLSMKQVLREVKLLAGLSHPNIIAYKQAWVEEATASFSSHWDSSNSETTGRDGSASDEANYSTPGEISEENVSESEDIHSLLYIQMELCGQTLDDTLQSWIKQSAYLYRSDTLKNAVLIIFKQLLEAVHYIHSKGIIHRDVKPANIFFVRSERLEPRDIIQDHDKVLVKLGDFGLATLSTKHKSSLGRLSSQPGSGLTKGVGTAIYAAPEQMTKTSYDIEVDIYSLGVVLAELLCLFPTAHERCQLERLHSEVAPDRLEELSKTERALVNAIKKMCCTTASLRPSAKDLLESGLVVTNDTILTESQEKEEMLSLLTRYICLGIEEAEDF